MGGDGGITRRAFLKLATIATAASALSALPKGVMLDVR
jgi:hypothetical protein